MQRQYATSKNRNPDDMCTLDSDKHPKQELQQQLVTTDSNIVHICRSTLLHTCHFGVGPSTPLYEIAQAP